MHLDSLKTLDQLEADLDRAVAGARTERDLALQYAKHAAFHDHNGPGRAAELRAHAAAAGRRYRELAQRAADLRDARDRKLNPPAYEDDPTWIQDPHDDPPYLSGCRKIPAPSAPGVFALGLLIGTMLAVWRLVS